MEHMEYNEYIVYYKRANDVVDCYLNFQTEKKFNVYNSANNYDYVTIGDKLLYLDNDSYLDEWKKEIPIYASDEGYFVNHSSCVEKIYQGYHLYTIYKSLDAFQKSIFPTKFVTGKDAFTKKPYIKATLYGGDKYGFRFGSTYFRFEYVNNKHILNVDFCSKSIQFSKKHSLHLLLEDGTVLRISDFKKPIKYSQNNISYLNINMTTSTTLSDQDVVILSSRKVTKWQLINEEGAILECMDFPSRIDHLMSFHRTVFLDFFVKYLSLYKDIKINTYDEEIEEFTEKDNGICYVYLMVDTTNNFHKIGISNNPKYREHTLQGEKPTIELLCAKEYPTRVIAEAIESALHKAFASKRIRGEWFKLSTSDIENIKQTLK